MDHMIKEKFIVTEGGSPLPGAIAAWTREYFSASDALVFVSACGIAVRAVAPCLENKARDPAVVCLDDRGRNVISLLSGHLGGRTPVHLPFRWAGFQCGDGHRREEIEITGRKTGHLFL